MRILLLSQWFDPEPTFKGLLFARALQRRGHLVQVITGFPNYPGGKLYPGYKIRLLQRQTIEGIEVLRVPLYPSHDHSAIGRVFNYVSFAFSSLVMGLFTRFRPDVIYVYHPPLTVGVAGAVIGLIRRVPFVCDIQDLWPDTLQATGMINNRRVLDIVGRVAKWVYGRAAVVIAQSPGFVKQLLARGVPKDKVELIYNWCDEGALQSSSEPGHALRGLEGRFNVVFAGNMGKAQALTSVLAAAALVKQRNPVVQFVFVGDGTQLEELKGFAASHALTNVLFMKRLPMDQVGKVLQAADALLVHLRRSPLFEITLPSKTQAYLFTGKPVVMAVQGDAADLVSGADAGVSAIPESPESIAGAVLRLASLSRDELTAMGARGRRLYQQTLSLDVGTARMIEVFSRAVESRRSRALRDVA